MTKQEANKLLIDSVCNQDTIGVETALKAGANPSTKYRGSIILCEAVGFSNYEISSILIDAGANVNGRNWNDFPVLMCARTPEMARLLIQSGADVNAAMGMTVLGYFAKLGKLDIVKVLLAAGADVNYRPEYLPSALMCACEGNKPETVRALIDAGANVNCMTESGKTALSEAAFHNNPEVYNLLISSGAKFSGKAGVVTLFQSVYFGKEELTKLCLDSGVDVNSYLEGRTPLLEAVNTIVPNIDMIKLLLSSGADITFKTKWKEDTPLLVALDSFGCIPETIRLLIQAGADVNKTGKDSNSALIRAIRRNLDLLNRYQDDEKEIKIAQNIEIVKQLIDAGADVNQANAHGTTPLLCAVEFGRPELVKLLLESGAKTNVRDSQSREPLGLAVKFGNLALVKMLLAYGANADVRDSSGRKVKPKASCPFRLEINDLLKNAKDKI